MDMNRPAQSRPDFRTAQQRMYGVLALLTAAAPAAVLLLALVMGVTR